MIIVVRLGQERIGKRVSCPKLRPNSKASSHHMACRKAWSATMQWTMIDPFLQPYKPLSSCPSLSKNSLPVDNGHAKGFLKSHIFTGLSALHEIERLQAFVLVKFDVAQNIDCVWSPPKWVEELPFADRGICPTGRFIRSRSVPSTDEIFELLGEIVGDFQRLNQTEI